MTKYEELRHALDTQMLEASKLKTNREKHNFIDTAFISIHTTYKEKQVTSPEYLKLVNRLAAYDGGSFNDYIDTLTGAAKMGMLEVFIQKHPAFTPEAAKQRSQAITDLTGIQPAKPEE